MNTQNILEKIQKLMNLADSPNESEAQAAMDKAQALMVQYNISISDILVSDESNDIIEDAIKETGRLASWESVLMAAVSKVNYCDAFVSRSRYKGKTKLVMVGKPHHVAVAKSMYDYLCATVERECKRIKKQDPLNKGRSWNASFKLGCASRISSRLKERMETLKTEGIPESNVSALVVVDSFKKAQQDITKYHAQSGRNFGKASNINFSNGAGYRAGQSAGDSVSLNAQVSSGKGQKLFA